MTGSLSIVLATALYLPTAGFAQDTAQSGTLVVDGTPGFATTTSVKGQLYVEVSALLQLLGARQEKQGNQIVVYLPGRNGDTQTNQNQLSRSFIVAGIDAVSTLRGWRHMVVDSVVNSFPFLEEQSAAFQRKAASELAVATAMAMTDADRSALELLVSESTMVRQFSDKYVERRKKSEGVFADEIENDLLGKKILDCAQGMAAMAVSREYQDVPVCR